MDGGKFAIAFVVFFVVAMLVWFKAPCGFWSFSSVGEMPARCVVELVHNGE